MKPIYTTIPILLCKYALVNRKVNYLKLYIYFKHIASGHIKYSNDNIKTWATDLDMSERWVKDALKWMLKNGWITVNRKKESYRIISYNQLCKKLNLNSTSAIVYEPEDFSGFKDFCCAAVITYCIKLKIYMDKTTNQSVSNLTDTSKSWYFYSKGYYAMPINYLAKHLGVSSSAVNKYKKCAINSGFIDVRKHFRPLFCSENKKLGVKHLQNVKKAFPSIAGRLRTNGKFISIVEADIMKSEIYMKRKRNKH